MTMEFQRQRSIYLQIADWLTDRIVSGEYAEGDRLPSVRECAAELEVNVNTMARAMEWLQQRGVVVVKRGMGAYVAVGARDVIMAMKREEFFSSCLPETFSRMRSLGIPIEEVVRRYGLSGD